MYVRMNVILFIRPSFCQSIILVMDKYYPPILELIHELSHIHKVHHQCKITSIFIITPAKPFEVFPSR